jgi:hypothetical protein
MWSLAVKKPDHSCRTRAWSFSKRQTSPAGGGTLVRALSDKLMNHGRRLLSKETAISKQSASLSPRA